MCVVEWKERTARPLYLYVASVSCAQVRHCTAMNRHHRDRGNQGVCQLFVPVLQPLDELGHLQTVLALFALMNSLVWVTVIWRTLRENRNKDKYSQLFSKYPLFSKRAIIYTEWSWYDKVQERSAITFMFNTEECPVQSSKVIFDQVLFVTLFNENKLLLLIV